MNWNLTVPNLYTLLSLLPPSHQVYTVLDLKDACFSISLISLVPVSLPIFFFEWTDPMCNGASQITWAHLLQWFKTFPTLFEKVLQRVLTGFLVSHPNSTLLQHVDDWQQPTLLPVWKSQRTYSCCSDISLLRKKKLSSVKQSLLLVVRAHSR